VNISLKKLVLLLLVRYAVTCHAITVTNYRFTWCSVVTNVIWSLLSFLKEKCRLMRSPFCLCLSVPLSTSEPIHRFLWNSVGRCVIEGDLNTIIFNAVAAIIPKWWVFRLLRSTWDHTILYADRSLEDEQLLIRPLLKESKNINMAGGWNLKFTFILWRELMNHCT
jgi:hypothetical protein